MTLPFIGSRSDSHSADVAILKGISFSLALSWCGVSTVLNPVPLANLNQFQPIATDS